MSETIHINGANVAMGRNWLVCSPGDITRAQQHSMISASGDDAYCAELWNERSRYVAFTVDRSDGSTDVYTVSPLGDISYIVTVDSVGAKGYHSSLV